VPAAAEAAAERLASMTWPEVASLCATTVLAVPVGSTEQHGPHLPVSTDTDIAVALTDLLAAARDDVVVAPPVAYGSSGEHAGFPGTLSIGQDALELLLVELGRSADAFAGVLFISTHGGNAAALARAVARLRAEGRRVSAWSPRRSAARDGPTGPGRADAHAGFTETSALMALSPEAVRHDAAEAGATDRIDEIMPALRNRGVAAVSPNGVLGDPSGASADAGRQVIDGWLADLVSTVEAWLSTVEGRP
jgi:mycofactocin system creatininase family protein